MNICFYTHKSIVSQNADGVLRVTASLCSFLHQKYDVKCYSAYIFPTDDPDSPTLIGIDDFIRFNPQYDDRNKFSEFIERNEIDIIICQGFQSSILTLIDIVKEKPNVRLIYVLHNVPGTEYRVGNQSVKEIWRENEKMSILPRVISILKFYCYYHNYQNWRKHIYHEACAHTSKVVLLSERFRKPFMKLAHFKGDPSCVTSIHNALSFDCFFDMDRYDEKKNEVLIVSRLAENEKNISYSLRVWKLIEKCSDLSDWTLRIVGCGYSENEYRHYVELNGLKRVVFEGHQESSSYYKAASLFVMTSLVEGWGLTVTEAQQYACVPIAFDYLTLSEMITDGENGRIIPPKRIKEFATVLTYLMKNVEERKRMAANAVESSKRFRRETIGEQWYQLFQEVLTDKSRINHA